MSKRTLYFTLLLTLVLSLVLASCATTEPNEPNEPVVNEPQNEVNEPEEPEEPEEPMDEEDPMLDLSGTTVTFWHVYGEGDPRNEAITAIVDEFNATNEYGITVEALDQGDYGDVEDKVNAGLQSGDLPAVAQAYTSALLNWDTVDSVVDLNQFVHDPDYGLTTEEFDAIYESVLASGETADGRRLSWPISQSANVVVYNHTWAQELGFDSPPTTTEEFKAQVCAAAEANANDDNPDNDGTGGMVWFPSASNYLSFFYAFGGSEVNEAGDAYDFNTEAAKNAALFINELRDAGCTFQTESYPNPEQAQRLALVTLSSTSGLRFYDAAFADVSNDDEWGFLAFPGPDGGQGANAFKQTMGIMKSTPEVELASWLFIKYLTTAENQASWIEGSGYLPTQATTETLLDDYIASVPQYASTIELAAIGTGEPETFSAWNSVRRAVGDAAAQLYAAQSEGEVVAILAELTETAAELVAEIQ